MVFELSLSKKIWIESMKSRWNSNGKYSQDSLRTTAWTWEIQERIIFMSMYNDIEWGERGNTEKCIANSVTVANYARRFVRTLDIFGTWIREEMVRNLLWINQTEIGTKLQSWCSTLQKAVHPIFRATSALERGELRSKEKGKQSIHFQRVVKKPLNWFFSRLFL